MGLMSWLRGGGHAERGAEAGAGAVSPAAVLRERVDLGELPPIQRTLGSQDLVIDPSGFQGSLSTRQDTTLGTPLGHLVSPDAPTGLVHGITTPAPVERTSPVQRSVERAVELPVRGRSGPVSASVSVPAPVSVPVPVQRAVSGGAPAMTSAGESAVAELPVRQLVGEQPFVPASTAPAPTPAPTPTPTPAPTPTPMSTSASAPVQRAVAPPVAERTRRAPGLGAPMSALPPTAQRQAAAAVPETGAEAAAGAEAIPVARSVEDGGAGNLDAPESREVPAAPEPTPDSDAPTAPLLGDAPLFPAPSESVPTPAPTSTHPSAPAVQRTPAVPAQAPMSPPPATAPVAPLLAERPVTLYSRGSGGGGAGADVQRSVAAAGGAASSPAGAGPGPGAVTVPLPDAVPVRWAPVGAGAPTVAETAPVPAALQRTATSSGDGPDAFPRQLPALQRQAVGGPPVPRSLPGAGSRTAPPAPTAPSFPTAGSVAVAAGVAQRMADGSVVFGSPPPPYSSPVVQRETETTEPPPPEPPQEPEPEPEPGPMAEDHDAPGAAASAPGAPPGQSGGHGGAAAPVVTDELVRALYTPLSRLFKADLRLERERAGFLINTRH
ncbi:hypothetical protein ACFWNT_16685 [Streptomyces sp. NPDC058409]|uniref:hypothetical protein n=1 Tax=Streptomyces sp. NPDC058409 TaxID=3346484 RepID=UPI003658940D